MAGCAVGAWQWWGQKTQRTLEPTGHRGLVEGLTASCLTLWATGAICRVCGALPRESCAAVGDVLPGPDLGFRVTEGLCSGPVAGADFTRGPHPNRLSFPAHAGNRRKGAFCKCLS